MLLIVCGCGMLLGYWAGIFAGGLYSRPAARVDMGWAQRFGGAVGLVGGYFAGLVWHLRILRRRRFRGRRLAACGARVGAVVGAACAAVLHGALSLATWQLIVPLASIGIGVGALAGAVAGTLCGVIAQLCYRR